MNDQKYGIIEAAEDACKEVFSFERFILKLLYKTSNMEALKDSFDDYRLYKFTQTIETFQYEYNKLTKSERVEFFEDLRYNEQNLNYLYKMFTDAFNSTYKLHMKILAKLSLNLIRNKDLNIYEATLLVNLPTLIENDLLFFYREIKKNIDSKENERDFNSVNPYKVSLISKFITMGFLTRGIGVSLFHESISYQLNDYSKELYYMLEEFQVE